MRAFWKFTVLRLGLFAAVVVVLGALRFDGLLLLLLAAVISFALSYVLLRGPRAELAEALAARAGRRVHRRSNLGHRIEDDAAAEDAQAQRALPLGGGTVPPGDAPGGEPPRNAAR